MNDEETEPPTDEEVKVEKLLIDKPSDFKFHAAYMAYSEAWDKLGSPETKAELNDLLQSLSKDEIEYSNFYTMLDEYRRHGSKHYEYPRQRIETQRKRDWRKKQTRSQRNSRHKGKH
jgi:hypothetical protein